MDTKYCRDCGERRPVNAFSANRRSRDGLAFYCRDHLAERSARSREARRMAPVKYRSRPRDVVVPDGCKWCPDCNQVKPSAEFPRSKASSNGLGAYCLPCHNVRGKQTLDARGGSRTYHLSRRYGITAEEADYLLEQQNGLCAICRAAPAGHVDHDHATGRVRELLCFNCNGGLGQFRDDPAVLRAAAEYVERHRARQAAAGEGSAGSRPGTHGRPGDPPVGSAQRRRGRSSAARRAGHPSTDSRQPAAGEENA
jgi:recombination endonuclease VII